jgi:hypothetical protein
MTDYIYDIETYVNCFTCAFEHAETPFKWMFEISDFRDDSGEMMSFLNYFRDTNVRMVGFNNLGFDYPVIHMFMKMNGNVSARQLYDKAMSLIEAEDDDRFTNTVWASDRYIEQLDLFKIHHFDNKARATSLKKLEFNMGSHSIQDLPFPVGSTLTREQIDILKKYNQHDVSETKKFYHHTLPMIKFREELTLKYQRDFMNHNDTKIGKDYFVMRLEEAGIPCYVRGCDGRKPRQTKRPQIVLRDAILPSIEFKQPEFTRVLEWLKDQVITETKGVFKDLTANVNGFEFVFGTGGIHGSVSNRIIEVNDDYEIIDLDVKSFYPNLAVTNNFYPEHLGEEFCKIYKFLYDQRSSYKKDAPENAMLKLALNGVYGDSNNPYSPFYDPLYTMKITLNGQLLLCKLAEELMKIGAEIIQVNTDGLTIRWTKHDYGMSVSYVCGIWEKMTGLTLERSEYKKMCIRDVNNYVAQYKNGSVKRKGAYEYEMGWHQDHSGLVIAKVAEQALLHDAPIAQTVRNWPDVSDFLICVKVPRSSYLEACGVPVQNTCRYYVSKEGVELNKWMPPLKAKPTEWRKIAVCKGRRVAICNDLGVIGDDWRECIDYDYYINEVEKLVMGLT